MKTFEKSIALALIFSVLLSLTGFTGQCTNISNKVFRLHVLANSDSIQDQQLKLKVRDKILEYSEGLFDKANTKKDAKIAAVNHIKDFEKVALDEIHNQGYDYPVKVEVTKMYFNTRHYNEVTMPAGKYDALRVLIGSGEGKNWWCVMFPAMCLPAAEERTELKDVLDDSEMDIVENGEGYEIKFKFVEILESVYEYLEDKFGDYEYEEGLSNSDYEVSNTYSNDKVYWE